MLHTGHHIRDDALRPDLRPILAMAQQAEKLGFDHVWVGDSSRMERGWPRADCIAMLAALAGATERIKIGVIPLSAPLRDPVLLAHQLATVDVLSGGRLLVSPAIGKSGPEGEREFTNCGVPYNERGPRLSEMLRIMKRLWTEPSVTFEGRFYHLHDATVFPKPINRPIPLYIATGRDERGWRRAARFGDGWFTTTIEPEAFMSTRRKIEDYARETGRDPSKVSRIGLYATVHLNRDGDKARSEAAEHMRAYFGGHRNTTTDFFGSPEEIARQLEPLVHGGLAMLVIRFVGDDLAEQAELTREALTSLRPLSRS